MGSFAKLADRPVTTASTQLVAVSSDPAGAFPSVVIEESKAIEEVASHCGVFGFDSGALVRRVAAEILVCDRRVRSGSRFGSVLERFLEPIDECLRQYIADHRADRRAR